MSDLISREKLLNEINLLKKSPWYNKDFAAVKLVRKDAVAIVEKCVEEAPGVAEWISVKDRLPKEYGGVLVFRIYNHRPIMSVDTYDTDRKRFLKYHNCGITHWMPLPELPKETDVE